MRKFIQSGDKDIVIIPCRHSTRCLDTASCADVFFITRIFNKKTRSYNILYFTTITFTLNILLASTVWPLVPPPPVNQLIGIEDSLLENPTEADCRICHGESLTQRHHLLVTTESRDCLDCHELVFDEGCQCLTFADFRDCLECHAYIPGSRPSTPHHVTQDARDRHCSVCHGSVVQDFDDDHYIPDYDISDVTPDPVCKTWDGPICVSGGCEVCHTEDTTAVPAIEKTYVLHHTAGFDCFFCHQAHGNIRDCESCHGPDSLHNIQADSDNPDNLGIVVPGQENLGWGHIGNGWDCFGCHESFNGSSTPQTGATVPSLSGLSTRSVTAQKDTSLDVYGSGFVNNTEGTTYTSDVVLDNGTASFTLQQVSQAEDQITVTVPATLPADLYDLRVIKDDKKSNKVILAVVPPVLITDVNCSRKRGVLTINGSGFSEKHQGTDDYINVEINSRVADIISWSDTQIKASVSNCSKRSTVTVNALYGSAASGSNGSGKPGKPCKSKRCN